MQDNYISRASTVAQSLTIDRNFARISERQESARINAFHHVFASHPRPLNRGFGRSAFTKLIKSRECLAIRLNNRKIFIILLLHFILAESFSSFCEPASCSGRQKQRSSSSSLRPQGSDVSLPPPHDWANWVAPSR